MKYFTKSLFLLLYCGLFLVFQPESAWVFFLVSLMLSVFALSSIVNYIRMPSSICLYDFFSTSLLLAYALSTFITQVKIYSLKSIDVARYFSIGQSSLSMALAGVSFSCALLVFASRIMPEKIQLPGFSRNQIRESLFVAVIVTLLGIYCILTGIIGFQGFIFADINQQSVSPLALMVSFTLGPMGILAVYLASGKYETSQIDKWLLYVLAGVLWLIMFTQARRLVVYLAMLYVIFYAIDTYGRTVWKNKFFFTGAVVFAAYFGVKLFYAFRIAGWELDGTKDALLLFKSGIDILTNPAKYDFDYLLSENTLERPFVIKYLAQVMEKVSLGRQLSGEALYATILISIPSALIGLKTFATDEELIHPRIGLVINDDANTVLTSGVADFGWFGMLLFPILVVLVVKALLLVVRKSNIRWVDYFAQFGALIVLLNVENSMTQYWSYVRSTLIVLAMAFAFRFILNGIYIRKNGLALN